VQGACGVKRFVGLAIALALISAASVLAGCGDSPYEAAAKAIVQQLTKTGDELEAKAESANAQEAGTVDAQLAAIAAMKEAATGMSAAAAKAGSELRALTPPDAAADAFQSEYLSDLKNYSDNLKTLAGTLDYLSACMSALKGVIPQGGEFGVWADIYDLTQAGVNSGNVAQAADLLDTAVPLLDSGLQKWGAITPLDEVETEHGAVSTDLQKVRQTFTKMDTLGRSAAETGSESSLSELTLQWELAADQWDTMLSDLDSWFNKVNGLSDSTGNNLDGIQKSLSELAKTL
jgi:hypothetical protein